MTDKPSTPNDNIAKFTPKVVAEKSEVSEYIATESRAALDRLLKAGAKGILIVAETKDGWEQAAVPDSTFFVIGAISLMKAGLDKLLNLDNLSDG